MRNVVPACETVGSGGICETRLTPTGSIPVISLAQASALFPADDDAMVLKMDVEGAEFDIVTKADPALLKSIAVFSIEFHEFGGHKASELVDVFSRAGHSVSYKYTPSKRGLSFGMLWARR